MNHQHKMSKVQEQNEQLEMLIENYLEEIQKQKEINCQHEAEIQSLLKFNERLLEIIESQIDNRRDSGSLMPISERSERESDLMAPLNSLIKTRHIAARSQRGGAKSVKNQKTSCQSRLEALGKNLQHSAFLRSEDEQSFINSQNKSINNITSKLQPQSQSIPNDTKQKQVVLKIQKDIQSSMNGFKNCAQKNKGFYDKKINQLQNLSDKIGSFNPQSKFQQISKKVHLSQAIANLVKMAMIKATSTTTNTTTTTTSMKQKKV